LTGRRHRRAQPLFIEAICHISVHKCILAQSFVYVDTTLWLHETKMAAAKMTNTKLQNCRPQTDCVHFDDSVMKISTREEKKATSK